MFKKAWLAGALIAISTLASSPAQAAASVAKDFLEQITGPVGSIETPVGTVNRGDVVTMKIDVLNNANALTAGALTDNFPTGMVLAPTPNPRASAGCGGGISYSASGGASSFGFSSAQVPAQSSGNPGICSVFVDVVVPLELTTPAGTTVTLNNTITLGAFTATDTITSGVITTTSPTTRSLSVRSLNNLTAAKTFTPTTVNMGETSTIQIVLSNPNTALSVAVSQLTEDLPGNVVATGVVPTVTGGGSCSGATASASGTSGSTTISFTGLTLAPNASCTVNWVVRGLASNGNGNTTAPAANTVPANSVINDRGLPQAATAATLVVQSPLSPTKSFAPNAAAANQPVTMSIALQNRTTTQTLSSVGFTDALPSNMTLLATLVTGSAGCGGFTPFTPTLGDTSLTVGGLTLAPGATCTLTASVTTTNDGSYPNTIPFVNYTSSNPSVGTRQSGPASATLTVYDQITVNKAALDPRSTDATAAGSAAPGNLIRYRLNINNYTSSVQSGLSLTDPLPVSGAAQLVFLTTPAPTFNNCGSPSVVSANGASSAQFSNITIAAGSGANPQICTIDYFVQIPASWPVGTAIVNGTNALPISVTQGGPNLLQGGQPNTSTPTVQPFSMAKAVANGTLFQGGNTVVTVTLTNNNYVDLTNVSLIDSPLFNATGSPSEVVLNTPANPSTTCSGVPSFNAVAGTTSFQASGLRVPQRGSCTVSFSVRGIVPGTAYPNTIPTTNVAGSALINGVTTTLNPDLPAAATLTVNSVLSLAKSFAPTSVAPTNGIARVTVQINNLGAQSLTNLQVVDPLPSSLQLAPSPNPSTSCSGPTTFTTTPGANSATLSGATVAGGGSCLFQFNVVTNGVGGGAASVNTIPASNVTADNGVFNASPASATLNKIGSSSVNVTKSFSPASLTSVGQSSRLQVTLDNSSGGAVALSNLALTDNLPSGMVVADVPAPSTTCPGGVVTASPRGITVALSGGTLAAAATCVFEANVTLVGAGTFNNTIPTAAIQNDQGITNANPFTANLQALASLGVTKSFNPTAVTPGSITRLTLQLINSQALQINLLGLTDIFPAGVVAASPAAATTTCPSGTLAVSSDRVVLTGGSLPAATLGSSTSCEVSLNVVAAAVGTYVNTIPVGGATGTDGNGGQTQNTSPASATLNVRAAVPVTKSFASANVLVGQSNRLTINIDNTGNTVALTDAVLQDDLPSGVTVAQTPNASTTNCGPGAVVTATAGSSLVRVTNATLPAGGVCVVQADVLSNTPGTYLNTIPDNALQTAQGVTNPSPATATFSTYEPPTVGKEFTPVQIASGGVSTLRVVLGNVNASALTLSAALTDTLPTGLTLGTPAIDTTTTDALPRCAGASGTTGGTTITVASGGLLPGLPTGGCVVLANVTGTVSGQFTNVIPAGALQTNAGNNQDPAEAVLSISTRNSIAGKVYLDTNNNGTPGSAEPALVAQTVTLERLDAAGAVQQTWTSTTNTLGNYAFVDLPDSGTGSYRVREPNQPLNTLNGITSVGTLGGGVATALTVTPSQISGITLNGGQNATDYNFGEVQAASLAGKVFLDQNNNGTQQSNDTGLSGVLITLQGTNDLGAVAAITTTTAADGSYRFSGLRPGAYTVTEGVQPTGTSNGLTVLGTGAATAGVATALAQLPSAFTGVVLASGQAAVGYNFAEVQSASISGRVYGDDNNNGVIDTNERGLPGVSVTLTGLDSLGAPITPITVVTGADGSYSFTSLSPGTYQVTEPNQPLQTLSGITSVGTINNDPVGAATSPTTVPSAISNIVLAAALQSVNNNFGEIGNSPELRVSKSHAPARFTTQNVGTYTLTVRNSGEQATAGSYTVSDRLPAGLTLSATPTGTGWTCTGAPGDSTFSCTSSTVLAAGTTGTQTITALVAVNLSAVAASPVQNVVLVDGGGESETRRPTQAERDAFASNPVALPQCDPAVLHNVCRDPTPVQEAASLAGTVWFDGGATSRVLDSADRRLPNWLVEVVSPATGLVVGTATTAADGSYRINNLIPGEPLAVRFRDPTSNVVFGYPVNGESAPDSSGATCNQAAAIQNGTTSSCVLTGASTELGVVLAPGQNLAEQSLPVDPSGVVYDANTRQPVPGSIVSLAPSGLCVGYNPATALVNVAAGGYTLNGTSASMTVGADGFYQFLFAPSAPASCTFTLSVVPPAGYTFVSTAIPPESTTLTPPGGLGSTFAVQPQATAPTAVPGPATIYYLAVNSGSNGANIIHNHIPLDPAVPPGLALIKTGDKTQAEVGDSVLYTVTVRQTSGGALGQVTVRDRLPAGFTLIRGTARVNGASVADPTGGLGPTLAFNVGPIAVNGQVTLNYRVRVGVGSQQGDGTNRAQAFGCGIPTGCLSPGGFTPLPGAAPSNEGRHRVKVTGGVFTNQACVLGKVFVDCNNNHLQDAEELGIPGVRMYFEDGAYLVSDSEGKYSQCDISPKSHVLKVDPLTLPRGSRLTTSSNRNLGDAGSLFIDLKNGELHRADFVEGSCSNTVLEQVKARRSQGEVRSVESEKKKSPVLKFQSKLSSYPTQGTDSARQPIVKPRPPGKHPDPGEAALKSEAENNLPVPELPSGGPLTGVPLKPTPRTAGGAHAE